MKHIIFPATVVVLSTLVFAAGQTAYEDPQGRFTFDPPPGWTLAPQTNENVFVFQVDGMSIIIEYVPGMSDTEALMKKAEAVLRASGQSILTLEGDLLEMKVNRHPARWGVYRYGLLADLTGAIGLKENGLYFFSIVNQNVMADWKERLAKSFQSIRVPGETVVAIEDVRTIAAPVRPSVPWKSSLVGLMIPAGWSEKPKPRGFEKEIQGWFLSDDFPGASLMVVCYKGFGMTRSKAFEAGIKTMTIAVPGMKPVEAQELDLKNGKASYTVYRGMAAAAGTEVDLVSVIVTTKADKSYTNLILTGQASFLPGLTEDALKIAQSVK